MPSGRHLAAAALLCGCFGNTSTEFPAGLEPLEDNLVPTRADPVETLDFLDGDNGNYAWVHARAWMFLEPAAAWDAFKDPELMAAVCSTDAHTVEVAVEPDYEQSFQLSYQVDEVINVAWDELWRYGTIEGTPDAPTFAMIRYQKVYGSELITVLEGSIQLHATADPQVIELEMIEHLAAAGGSVDDMRGSMQHRFDSVAAAVRGEALPVCP